MQKRPSVSKERQFVVEPQFLMLPPLSTVYYQVQYWHPTLSTVSSAPVIVYREVTKFKFLRPNFLKAGALFMRTRMICTVCIPRTYVLVVAHVAVVVLTYLHAIAMSCAWSQDGQAISTPYFLIVSCTTTGKTSCHTLPVLFPFFFTFLVGL